jgi:hypothetical protein
LPGRSTVRIPVISLFIFFISKHIFSLACSEVPSALSYAILLSRQRINKTIKNNHQFSDYSIYSQGSGVEILTPSSHRRTRLWEFAITGIPSSEPMSERTCSRWDCQKSGVIKVAGRAYVYSRGLPPSELGSNQVYYQSLIYLSTGTSDLTILRVRHLEI